MTMSEKNNAAWTVGFLSAIILIFMITDFLNEERLFSPTENRILASRPEMKKENLINGKFMEDYEAYVTDQFIARDTWVELKTRGDILLQRREINGVYLGEDDYLIEQHLPQTFSKEQVDAKLKLLTRLVEKYNAKVMLVPTADNILSDKLPDNAPFYDQRQLLDRVKETVGEQHYIEIYDTLKAHSEEEIYYRTDHHWTTLGAYYGYQAWKKQTGATSVVRLDPVNMTSVTDHFLGTLHSRINLPHVEDKIMIFPETYQRPPRLTYDLNKKTSSYYEADHLDTKNKYGYFLDDNHAFVEIETGYRRGRELILIKDSYANCLVPLLANHYDKIYVVDLRYYNSTLSSLIDGYVTPQSDVLVMYNCIHFLKDFKYY